MLSKFEEIERKYLSKQQLQSVVTKFGGIIKVSHKSIMLITEGTKNNSYRQFITD